MRRVLKTARESACQPEHRTKQGLANAIGIQAKRVTGIEDGTSECTLDLAIAWCEAVEDQTAKAKILHMYDLGLPVTNPLLIDNPLTQILNFKRQAAQAIDALDEIMDLSIQLRPGDNMAEKFKEELYRHAEEILDMKQASDCLLESLRVNWGLDRGKLRSNWTLEALADGILIQSVSHYEEIKKNQIYAERAATL